MNSELIIALAKLSDKGVDVNKLLDNESEPKPTEQTKEDKHAALELALATLLKKEEPKEEPKKEEPKKEEVKSEAKEEVKSEAKEEKQVGFTEEQFTQLLQSLNTSKASIDLPNSDDWKSALSSHFDYLINGERKEGK